MQTRNFRFTGNRGFTLIEMLVVVALTMFIMTLFTTLFTQATSGMNDARGIARVDQNLRTAMTLIRKDLSDVYIQGKVNSPGQAFADTESRPTGGYFMLEENSPAIRQGVDSWGVPVDVDVDDVLQFTAKRKGTSASEVFYGIVEYANPAAPSNYEVYLDNYGAPKSRFDERNNGLTSSVFGEIAIFLRPDIPRSGAYPSFEEIRGHQADDGNPANGTEGPTKFTRSLIKPMTYTLYRRQLVVLDEGASRDTTLVKNVPTTGFHSRFDVSAKPDPANPTTMRFNHMGILDERRNRYGLNDVDGNEFPFSWKLPGSNIATAGDVDAFSSSVSQTIHRPSRDQIQWFGRPISVETNLSGGMSDFFATIRSGFSAPDEELDGSLDDGGVLNGILDYHENASNTFLTADTAWESNNTFSYRHGEDVLLENVLSFDVKVYDDDGFRTDNAAPFSAAAGSSIGVNVTRRNASANPANDLIPTDQRTPEFVDLGYRQEVTGSPEIAIWGTLNDVYEDPSSTDLITFAENRPFGFPERWRMAGRIADATSVTGITVPTYVPVRTYDTWSDSYEVDPAVAAADSSIILRPIPYSKPLKAVQIRIRVLDPKTGIVREATMIHRFP